MVSRKITKFITPSSAQKAIELEQYKANFVVNYLELE